VNLEESLAALTRTDAVMLADGVVSTDGTKSVLAGRRSDRLGLRQGGLDGRRQGAGRRRSRMRRRRNGEVAGGRSHVTAGG